MPPQPPRGQRPRTAAGLSLAVLAPLAGALAFLVLAFDGPGASIAAVAALALAGVAVSTLLARDAAARSAREQAERQWALLAELPVATYTGRLSDSRAEYVSPQIERLLELTAEQALDMGDFWTPRLHELDRERVLRHWRAWCAEPAARPFRHTYRLLAERGRAVWVEDVTVLAGGRGGARTFQRHLLDVTRRHRLRPLAAAEFEPPEEPQPLPVVPLGGQEAILVVEDEPALRVLEEVTLEDAGYEVYAAADAAEALGLAGRHGLDAMVVNVVLPGLSGTQLVDELAARGFDFPAVFVSADARDEAASHGLERAAAVIEKPFSPEALLRAVREALDAAAATVVPLPQRDATRSQLVRCLGCGAHYRRPLTHLSLAGTTCPKCEYVGWASVDEQSARD